MLMSLPLKLLYDLTVETCHCGYLLYAFPSILHGFGHGLNSFGTTFGTSFGSSLGTTLNTTLGTTFN